MIVKAHQELIKDVFKRMVFAETEQRFNEWFTRLETFLNEHELPQVLIVSPLPITCFSARRAFEADRFALFFFFEENNRFRLTEYMFFIRVFYILFTRSKSKLRWYYTYARNG